MAYANWIGIIKDRTACYADETEFLKGIYFVPTGLAFTYYAGGAIPLPLFGTMPEDNNMETYQGLRITDRWYSVRLVDFPTRGAPVTGIAFGNVIVGYGFEGDAAETNMPVLVGDWREQGGGDYWLRMGVAEFANFGKYTVRVSSTPVGIFADRSFVVEVTNTADNVVWDAVTTGHDVVNSFGQMLNSVRANVATAGAPGSITLDLAASAVNNFYNDNIIFVSKGLGIGQARIISAYDGVTKIATITPNWAVNPGALSEYVIIPTSAVSLSAAAIINGILDADLQLHLGAGVGFRNIGNILGQLAQSEFEYRTNVFAAGAVVAQGITIAMATSGCIQYQQVDMSYTKTWGAPDRTYYLLYHYDVNHRNDVVKASLGNVW